MKSKNFELKDCRVYYNREILLSEHEITEVWADFEVEKVHTKCNEFNLSSSELKELHNFLTQAITSGEALPRPRNENNRRIQR